MIAAGIERRLGGPRITWTVGDAQHLPLPDNYANAYVIALRHPQRHRHRRGLREARRVLKPGEPFPVPGVPRGR
ncbi:methyltransferase domain-containing protein [Caulobacter segnis]